MAWFSKSTINPCLQRTRAKATFDVEKLTLLLYNGTDEVEKKRSMYNKVLGEIEKLLEFPISLIERPDIYEEGLRRCYIVTQILKKSPEWNNFDDKFALSRMVLQYNMSPLLVHDSMFTDLVENQITDDQKKMWMDDIRSYNIVGTYAQTELGHGTNVQALETTATYDPTSEEFIINSPTLTSTKFWPGGLGKSANHVAAIAQLIIGGKKCGVHPFLVQIRDRETNIPVKGITVGDIGPKFGWNSIDNGYLRFANVRIPRMNMFMKYYEVLKDGTFRKSGNQSKTVYGTLVHTRVMCVPYYGGKMVGMAASIATRYSCVAPSHHPSARGKKLFEMKYCQHILISSFSTCFAMWFAGSELKNWYSNISPTITSGDATFLPELHAISSGLKALSTNKAVEEIEKCRQLCGKDGHLLASALPKLYDHVSPGMTIDGENTVLYLQLARYLIKVVNEIHMKGETTKHLDNREWTRTSLDEELRLEGLIEAHEYLASRLLNKVNKRMKLMVKSGLKAHEAWNKCSVDLVRAAEIHSVKYAVDSFLRVVRSIEDIQLQLAMSNLLRYYAALNLISNKDVLLQDGFVKPETIHLLVASIEALVEKLALNAMAFGDAFDHTDIEVDSCIGNYDGGIFQKTFESTQIIPLDVDEDVRRIFGTLRKIENAKL